MTALAVTLTLEDLGNGLALEGGCEDSGTFARSTLRALADELFALRILAHGTHSLDLGTLIISLSARVELAARVAESLYEAEQAREAEPPRADDVLSKAGGRKRKAPARRGPVDA